MKNNLYSELTERNKQIFKNVVESYLETGSPSGSETVLKRTSQGKKIINKLFKTICKKPKKFIRNENFTRTTKERCVCDYIAGMTDRFAINLYNSTK